MHPPDIAWSEQSYTLAEILTKFPLPQLIRYLGPERDATPRDSGIVQNVRDVSTVSNDAGNHKTAVNDDITFTTHNGNVLNNSDVTVHDSDTSFIENDDQNIEINELKPDTDDSGNVSQNVPNGEQYHENGVLNDLNPDDVLQEFQTFQGQESHGKAEVCLELNISKDSNRDSMTSVTNQSSDFGGIPAIESAFSENKELDESTESDETVIEFDTNQIDITPNAKDINDVDVKSERSLSVGSDTTIVESEEITEESGVGNGVFDIGTYEDYIVIDQFGAAESAENASDGENTIHNSNDEAENSVTSDQQNVGENYTNINQNDDTTTGNGSSDADEDCSDERRIQRIYDETPDVTDQKSILSDQTPNTTDQTSIISDETPNITDESINIEPDHDRNYYPSTTNDNVVYRVNISEKRAEEPDPDNLAEPGTGVCDEDMYEEHYIVQPKCETDLSTLTGFAAMNRRQSNVVIGHFDADDSDSCASDDTEGAQLDDESVSVKSHESAVTESEIPVVHTKVARLNGPNMVSTPAKADISPQIGSLLLYRKVRAMRAVARLMKPSADNQSYVEDLDTPLLVVPYNYQGWFYDRSDFPSPQQTLQPLTSLNKIVAFMPFRFLTMTPLNCFKSRLKKVKGKNKVNDGKGNQDKDHQLEKKWIKNGNKYEKGRIAAGEIISVESIHEDLVKYVNRKCLKQKAIRLLKCHIGDGGCFLVPVEQDGVFHVVHNGKQTVRYCQGLHNPLFTMHDMLRDPGAHPGLVQLVYGSLPHHLELGNGKVKGQKRKVGGRKDMVMKLVGMTDADTVIACSVRSNITDDVGPRCGLMEVPVHCGKTFVRALNWRGKTGGNGAINADIVGGLTVLTKDGETFVREVKVKHRYSFVCEK